jgi:hypothetical protein
MKKSKAGRKKSKAGTKAGEKVDFWNFLAIQEILEFFCSILLSTLPQVYIAGDQKKAFVGVVGFKGVGFCEVFRVQGGRFRGLRVWGFEFKGCKV